MKNRKGGYITLVEILIVTAIVALLAAIMIPAFVTAKQEAEKKDLTPVEYNEWMLKKCDFKKVAEFRGYDIYTFYANDARHSVAIPITNSVYDLERK